MAGKVTVPEGKARDAMFAEHRVWYGSAAAMMFPERHQHLVAPRQPGRIPKRWAP